MDCVWLYLGRLGLLGIIVFFRRKINTLYLLQITFLQGSFDKKDQQDYDGLLATVNKSNLGICFFLANNEARIILDLHQQEEILN